MAEQHTHQGHSLHDNIEEMTLPVSDPTTLASNGNSRDSSMSKLNDDNDDVPSHDQKHTKTSRDTIPPTVPTPPPHPQPEPQPPTVFRAWSQVAVAHLGSFNSWGYMNSFGLFQSYYTTSLSTSPSAISWIGSLQIFLAFGVGSVSGRALDAGYLRAAVFAGCTLQVIAIMSASVAGGAYWQLLLAQGLCKGLGDGLVFCPTVANVPTYFPAAGVSDEGKGQKGGMRAVAMGIAACGTATGGIVFPLIAQRLMPTLGYGWTVRVMGFIVLFNAAVMLVLVKPRFERPRGGKEEDCGDAGQVEEEKEKEKKTASARLGGFFEWSAFRDEPPYAFFCAGMFCAWLALYFAFYYVSYRPPRHLSLLPRTRISYKLR